MTWFGFAMVASCLLAGAPAFAGEAAGQPDCDAIVELRAMAQAGSAVRKLMPDADPRSKEWLQAFNRATLVDRRNNEKLGPWLKSCGWPDARNGGEEREGLVWLLVQHADQDRPLQDFAVGQLRKQVLRGGAPPIHLAYLEDRIAIGRNRPQRYGTQLEPTGPCSLEFLPLDNRKDVDARRAEIGMESLDRYLMRVREQMLPASCAEAVPGGAK